MKLTPAKCPSCGADIEVNSKLENTICQYCGTTVLIEDAIAKYKLEISGKVEVEGITSNKSRLESVRKYIKLKEFRSAENILNSMISADTLNEEAYLERVKLYLAVLEENGFDGSADRYSDKENWGYVDIILKTLDRIKKIDDDNSLKSELKKIQPKIDKFTDYTKKLDKDKEQYAECVEKINVIFNKQSKYNSRNTGPDVANLFGTAFKFDTKFSNNSTLVGVDSICSNGDINLKYKDGSVKSYPTDTSLNVETVNGYLDVFEKSVDKYYKKLDGGYKVTNTFTILFLIISVILFLVPIISTLILFFQGHGFTGILMIFFVDSWLVPIAGQWALDNWDNITTKKKS